MAKFKVGDYVVGNKKAFNGDEDEGIVIASYKRDFTIVGEDGLIHDKLKYDCFDLGQFTRDDLRDGDIITLKNGWKLIVQGPHLINLEEYESSFPYMGNLNRDLTCIWGDRRYEVFKVERPIQYVDIHIKKNPRKMTVSQICKELGYDVEIVKDDE